MGRTTGVVDTDLLSLFLFPNFKHLNFMKLELAQRKRAKIKMCLQGPSGSGKTMSALLVAFGLCSDWSKIAVIDTENRSAELYAHLGSYSVVNLTPPYTPEKYAEAIELCEKSAIEVIIIDSLTHEWEYLLDYHSNLPGNSFTAWGKITPRHNQFVKTILHSTCNVISTIRTKQDYVLVEKNNKQVPEKVGLKGIQRDGIEYDFTIVFDLDIKNNATASKDRTGLFFGKPEQKLSISTGVEIAAWCNSGVETGVDDVSKRICDTASIKELLDLYHEYPQFKEVLKAEFEQQKRRLLIQNEATKQLTNLKNVSTNGIQ
jgi:hypothetical protein